MGEKRRIVLLIFLLSMASSCVWASEPGRFAISQVSVKPPIVNVYIDVLDENGQPPVRLVASELSAAIQGQAVKVAQVTPFDASGEGVAYIFLVDISKSIGVAQFAQIRQAIDDWIDGLKSADQMAIFTFGDQYKQLMGFRSDKAELKRVMQTVRPTDRQTKLYLALNSAVNLSRRNDPALPSRRVIVILSDGKDEGSGITAEDVRELIQQSHVPIYAIGYSRLPVSEREKYLEVLNRFATLSGGIYAGAESLKTAYEEMQNTIRSVFVVRLDCDACRTDSQPHPLELTLTSGTVARTGSLNVNLIAPATPTPQPATPEAKKWWEVILSWKILLSLLLVVSLSFTIAFHVELKDWIWGPKKRPDPVAIDVPPVIPIESEPSSIQPSGRHIQLTVLAGKERGRTYYLKLVDRSVIGRDKGCDASFPDDTEMSGRHCELIPAGQHVEIVDLGSTNGTLLNGAQLVTKQRLEDGDLVRAGRTEFRINFSGGT